METGASDDPQSRDQGEGEMIRTLWIELKYSIDGKMTSEEIIRAVHSLISSQIAFSENFDDGERYALIVESTEVHLKPRRSK